MRKCSIDNCNNFCGYSSHYICDKCNSVFLEGRLSFGKSSKGKLKLTSINQRGKIKRTVEKPKITSINERGSIKCKIVGCNNRRGSSSFYDICDNCYGRLVSGIGKLKISYKFVDSHSIKEEIKLEKELETRAVSIGKNIAYTFLWIVLFVYIILLFA